MRKTSDQKLSSWVLVHAEYHKDYYTYNLDSLMSQNKSVIMFSKGCEFSGVCIIANEI